MNFEDYLNKVESYFDHDFYQNTNNRLCKLLLPQNCWCPLVLDQVDTLAGLDPGMALSNVHDAVIIYYSNLSLLVTKLLQKEPLPLIWYLDKIKEWFFFHGISLNELLMGEGRFSMGAYNYSPEVDPLNEALAPMRFVIYLPRFSEPKNGILTGLTPIENRLTDLARNCLSPFSDNDTIEKMRRGKWDAINYPELLEYAKSVIEDKSADTSSQIEHPPLPSILKKECKHCGKAFFTDRKIKKYCSNRCRNIEKTERYRIHKTLSDLKVSGFKLKL